MDTERNLETIFDSELKDLLVVSYIVLCNNAVSNGYMERRFDMPVQAWSSLLAIDTFEGIRAKEIRALFPRPQNTISRAVSLLERRKLIVQRPSETDAREKLLYITAAGRRLLDEIREVSRRRQEELFGVLTKSERRTFFALASKIANGASLRDSRVMSDES